MAIRSPPPPSSSSSSLCKWVLQSILILSTRKVVVGLCADIGEYLMPIPDYAEILDSELMMDYGLPLSRSERSVLWEDQTSYEWQYTEQLVLDAGLSDVQIDAPSSNSDEDQSKAVYYRPYVICNTVPDVSGKKRAENISALFIQAGAATTRYLDFTSSTIYNGPDRSCYMYSTLMEPWEKICKEGASDYIQIQPFTSSMKMVEGIVDSVRLKLRSAPPQRPPTSPSGEKEGSQDDEDEKENVFDPRSSGTKPLGLLVTLCPAPVNFRRALSYPQIEAELTDFLTANNGSAVHDASYFVRIASNQQSQQRTISSRIKFWSEAIINVTSRDVNLLRYDDCMNIVLATELEFFENQVNRTIGVMIKDSVREKNIPDDVLETCVWYLLAGVALHPFICRVEEELITVINPPPPSMGDDGKDDDDMKKSAATTMTMMMNENVLFTTTMTLMLFSWLMK